MENRRLDFREVRLALEKCHQSKVKSRQKVNSRTINGSAEAITYTGDLVLVEESNSNINRNGREHAR